MDGSDPFPGRWPTEPVAAATQVALARVPSRLRLLLPLVGAGAGVALLAVGSAYAYWQLTDSSNHAAATAGTLTAPGGGAQNGSATPTGIPVNWAAPSGYTPTGYSVLRCSGSGCTPVAVTSGGCSGQIQGTSCTDTDPSLKPGTTYTYAVTSSLDDWTSSADTPFQAATTGPAKLDFTKQPATGATIQATGTGTFDVAVTLEDQHGATVTNDSTDQVTLAIDNNPGHGTLTCQGGLTATAASGVAMFTGCAITKAGSGYTLTASSSNTPALTSPSDANHFDIVAGKASKLAFTSSSVSGPRSATANLGPVTVEEQDANGNAVKATGSGVAVGLSASSSKVTFAAGQGSTGLTSVTIAAGSSAASFYVGDSKAESPAITVTSNGLTAATQTEFAGSEKLVILSQPVTGTASASATNGPVTVQLQTTNGVPVTTGITLDLSSNSKGINEFATTSGGASTTSLVIQPGSSQASFYYGDELAGSPVVTIAADNADLSSVGSAKQTETINAGPAAGLTFSNVTTGNQKGTTRSPSVTCTGTVGSASFSCSLSNSIPQGQGRYLTADVSLIDQFQNVVTNTSGSDLTVSLSQQGGTSITPQVSIPAGQSQSGSFTEDLADGSDPATISAGANLGSATISAALNS